MSLTVVIKIIKILKKSIKIDAIFTGSFYKFLKKIKPGRIIIYKYL